MKNILLVILAISLYGCGPDYKERREHEHQIERGEIVVDSKGREYEKFYIGKCEYLESGTHSNARVVFHKGDCKNPIHYTNH